MTEFRRSVRVAVVALFLLAMGLIVFSSARYGTAHGAPPMQGGVTPTPVPRRIPPNEPARGLVYDGLEPGVGDVCRGAFKLRDSNHCTHGPDPVPPGVNIKNKVAPVSRENAPSAAAAIQCDGDGISGYRTQVMYVRPSDHMDQYSTYLASFRQWAADADQIYSDSAVEMGGYRRLRFVHDGVCNIIVSNVVIPGAGNVTFYSMVDQLIALGYNRSDRKYMIFMDAYLYCGIASLYVDDSPGQTTSTIWVRTMLEPTWVAGPVLSSRMRACTIWARCSFQRRIRVGVIIAWMSSIKCVTRTRPLFRRCNIYALTRRTIVSSTATTMIISAPIH
jgi:hypothetical protein